MDTKVKLQFTFGDYGNPPNEEDVIYHYCSMDTFFNIVKFGKVRLGDLKSMNDPSEMRLQEINIGAAVLQEYRNTPFDFDIGENGNNYTMEEFLYPSLMEFSMGKCGKYSNLLFAFCLSTKCNDLSQWRLYGDNGKGVCLGFRKSQIEKFIKEEPNYHLEEIEYFKTINDVVSNIAKEILSKIKYLYENGKIDELKKFRFEFMHELSNLWPKYKVSDYSSENEVRLIYKLNNSQIFVNVNAKDIKKDDINGIDVRVRNGEFVLYKELPLENLGLTSITIGPLNNTIKDSINIFLAKNNVDVKANNIYKSTIPYRT